jgi:hypothetical protein
MAKTLRYETSFLYMERKAWSKYFVGLAFPYYSLVRSISCSKRVVNQIHS